MATHLIVSALVLVALLGCAAASLFAGVLVGEERARRRFDEAMAAKFGGGSSEGDGGESASPPDPAPSTDESDSSAKAAIEIDGVEIGDVVIDAEDLAADLLPRTPIKGGTSLVWIVSGPGPWRLC